MGFDEFLAAQRHTKKSIPAFHNKANKKSSEEKKKKRSEDFTQSIYVEPTFSKLNGVSDIF